MGEFNVGCVEDAFGRGQEVLDACAGSSHCLRRAVAQDLFSSLDERRLEVFGQDFFGLDFPGIDLPWVDWLEA